MLSISRRSAIAPFVVMDVMEKAEQIERAGRRVYHLEVGQPSTSAPTRALAAAEAAMRAQPLGYTVAVGQMELRKGIADLYRRRYGLDLPPDRIIATAGSSGGFVLAFLAAFDVGSRVAVAEPGYPCYRNILASLGIEVVSIAVGADTHYQLTSELLESHGGDVDGVIVASPSNPTGSMLDRTAMSNLVHWCATRGIRLISDEIYHGITFGQHATTAASFNDQVIVVNSFSKYFSMTGWRIGWLVLPPDLVRAVEKLAQNLFIAPTTISQIAATAALGAEDELCGHLERYALGRAAVMSGLASAGITEIAPPDGAFYVYARCPDLTGGSAAFCSRLLEETGVAITPGVDFDAQRGREMIRFSYAGSTKDIEAGMERFVDYVCRTS
ncbi:aspartate/tyrosine/aromatic aminotransferase [Bradyrhizobium sp. YR681]|uniref:pyridoxal phosphate-dependent aminotransferase n=1 Tax=Bradyrhizobium sp. YR681 TaxID=1144344 RepID=UPI0002711BB3|nr:aminotransferase class I/II-fold pyridoxal phosphate-dependent enzyme [Bradyrhizobium sp. YR681]EJN13529.1 aspartate/tyrosine/aromatic aminotransferase [Bradyrhizobium sp. YR681]